MISIQLIISCRIKRGIVLLDNTDRDYWKYLFTSATVLGAQSGGLNHEFISQEESLLPGVSDAPVPPALFLKIKFELENFKFFPR